MNSKEKLLQRASQTCELCGSKKNLDIYKVEPEDEYIVVCETCKNQIENPQNIDPNHFRCLNESMWSEVPAVQVMAYRILKQISKEGWPQDLLDMLYLDDKTKEWAEAVFEDDTTDSIEPTRDSNGMILSSGDKVTIIKDLEVKGAGFTAKRGTVVKNITLTDNPEQIEGRVNGTKIVLLSKFLKKV